MTTQHVNIFKAYQLFFKNYFNFKGNSSRTEYWWAFFCNWLIRIIFLVWAAVGKLKGSNGVKVTGLVLLGIYCLAVLIPSVSLTVRRYRNAGISVYWILFTYLLPYLLEFTVHESMGETFSRLVLWNSCALLEFICLICAVIIPTFPTKVNK